MNEKIFLKRPDAEAGDVHVYEADLELEAFDLHGRHHEIPQARAVATVTTLAEGLHVELGITATVATTCDRTLEDVELPIEFGDSIFLESSDDEEIPVRDWTLDAQAYAQGALPSEVPMQVFAPGTEPVRQERKPDEIDSRWKGLGGLFASGF